MMALSGDAHSIGAFEPVCEKRKGPHSYKGL